MSKPSLQNLPDLIHTSDQEGPYTIRSSGESECWYQFHRVYKGDEPLVDLHANSHGMYVYWHLNHTANGHDYLLCGEDYQGITVVDLTTKEKWTYPFEGAEDGTGWCPMSFEHVGENILIAFGCYWAAPSNFQVYRFVDPHQAPLCLTTEVFLDAGWHTECHYVDGYILWEQHTYRSPQGWLKDVMAAEYNALKEGEYPAYNQKYFRGPLPPEWEKVLVGWRKYKVNSTQIDLVESWDLPGEGVPVDQGAGLTDGTIVPGL
jgi:hypothetical protein